MPAHCTHTSIILFENVEYIAKIMMTNSEPGLAWWQTRRIWRSDFRYKKKGWVTPVLDSWVGLYKLDLFHPGSNLAQCLCLCQMGISMWCIHLGLQTWWLNWKLLYILCEELVNTSNAIYSYPASTSRTPGSDLFHPSGIIAVKLI